MELQELLNDTNKIYGEIQLNHRNTLESNDRVHKQLGDIKDFLFDFIDSIGEYIIIKGGFAKFSKEIFDGLPTQREDIYRYSVKLIEGYLSILVKFYKEEDDLEIQNYVIDKTNELRKLWFKLKSTCPEMIEEDLETNEEEND